MKIDVQTSRLDAIMPQLLAKSKASAADVIDFLSVRFLKEVIPQTIRTTGRPKGAPVFESNSDWQRAHKKYLEDRIKTKRLRRWGEFSRSGRLVPGHYKNIHIAKDQVDAYYRRALQRQGELAAGWNAAAFALRVNPPAFVKRHGAVHGSFSRSVAPVSVIAHIRWEHAKGTHGNMDSIAATALKIVNDKALKTGARRFETNVRRAAAALRR